MRFIGSSRVNLLLLFLPLIFITPTNGEGATCNVNSGGIISLNQSMTRANQRMYDIVIPVEAKSGYKLRLADPAKSLSFIILEVHSQLHNVTLIRNTWSSENAIMGQNLGLYSSVANETLDTFYICNSNTVDVMVYINVLGYRETDPIPGGCNMEFPTPVAPYIVTTMNKDYITIDLAAPGSIDDPYCRNNDVDVHFYLLYFLEKYTTDFLPYFTNIGKMFEREWITKFGELLPQSGDNLRRRVATYHGMGVVFAAIASRNATSYSVYVPKGMFSCNPAVEGDCDIKNDYLNIITCVSLYAWGLFMCYFGHTFFKTSMMLTAGISGGILTYVLMSFGGVSNQTALISGSVSTGMWLGSMWLIWWFYGVPLTFVSLPALNIGFLIAGTIYYYFPTRLDHACGCEGTIIEKIQLMWDIWRYSFILILSLTMVTCMCMMICTTVSNIICCATLGAYSIIFATGYHISHNLNYIFINLMRYAVVPNFMKVSLVPPPRQSHDALIEVLFVFLALSGIVVQYYSNKGRPPFLPPYQTVRLAVPGHYGSIDQDNYSDDEKQQSKKPLTGNDEFAPLLG